MMFNSKGKKESIRERIQLAQTLAAKEHPNSEEIYKQLWKGRIPRALLLIGSFIGLFWIIAAFYDVGPMTIQDFRTYGRVVISLIIYVLLFLVSVRANFKCEQITCPSIFSLILLLGYYSYPKFLTLWSFLLLGTAFYIIVKTLYSYNKIIKSKNNK